MSLRNEDDPVIVVREKEGEFEGKTWVKDDKVVAYEDCGHILHDLANTRV